MASRASKKTETIITTESDKESDNEEQTTTEEFVNIETDQSNSVEIENTPEELYEVIVDLIKDVITDEIKTSGNSSNIDEKFIINAINDIMPKLSEITFAKDKISIITPTNLTSIYKNIDIAKRKEKDGKAFKSRTKTPEEIQLDENYKKLSQEELSNFEIYVNKIKFLNLLKEIKSDFSPEITELWSFYDKLSCPHSINKKWLYSESLKIKDEYKQPIDNLYNIYVESIKTTNNTHIQKSPVQKTVTKKQIGIKSSN
jgi:hypothetical protein